MTSITRYKLRKLLKYALVTVALVVVFGVFSGNLPDHTIGGWFLLGLWTGILEEFLFGRRFRSLVVPLQVLGKVLAVNLLTLLLLVIGALLEHPDALTRGASRILIVDLFLSAELFRVMLRVVVITTVAILVVQIEEVMGRRMFLGFLLGRYERPKAEKRIMLTMDLVGSTALAERLGDMRYYAFLNTTYSLMTDAVLRNEADIHKYIGDEVIFTWPMRIGTRDLNCLDLYFDIMDRLKAHEKELLAEFGAVPDYRAAVHGGRVITAQVGHIKRAIDFSGDAMNTVSRILGLSKTMGNGLLVSAELLEHIPGASDRFRFGEKETVALRGRKREVTVHTVERVGHA